MEILRIIKEKDIDIRVLKWWLKIYKNNGKELTYQDYLAILKDCDLGDKLTKDEFDLLKEWLK